MTSPSPLPSRELVPLVWWVPVVVPRWRPSKRGGGGGWKAWGLGEEHTESPGTLRISSRAAKVHVENAWGGLWGFVVVLEASQAMQLFGLAKHFLQGEQVPEGTTRPTSSNSASLSTISLPTARSPRLLPRCSLKPVASVRSRQLWRGQLSTYCSSWIHFSTCWQTRRI